MHQDTKSARLIAVCKRTFNRFDPVNRIGLVNRAIPLRIYTVCFFNIVYRDNSVKRDGNSHVIAFRQVGSATPG